MSKKRILIVEDEALTVLALQQELGELGYEIAGNASTAAEALRVAEDNRADLVLMDIQLDGGVSGIAAAAALRGQLDIPVVFLFAEALHRARIESGCRHRTSQTQHGNRDAPGAQFTIAGRYGT